MMNILHVHDYPPITGGGIAYFVHDLTLETDDIAHHNVFSTRCRDDVNADDTRFVGDRLFKKYDLVFFHFTYSIRFSAVLLVLALLTRQRIFSVMHCEKEHLTYGNLKKLPKPFRTFICAGYEFLISLSNRVICFNEQSSMMRYRNSTNVMQFVSVGKLLNKNRLNNTTKKFGLFSGDTSSMKGFDVLLDLARTFKNQRFCAATNKIGNKESEIPPNISLLGILPREKLHLQLRYFEYGLVLSKTECWSRFAHESFILGVKVISTVKAGIFRHIEDDDYIYLYINTNHSQKYKALENTIRVQSRNISPASVSKKALKINKHAILQWRSIIEKIRRSE